MQPNNETPESPAVLSGVDTEAAIDDAAAVALPESPLPGYPRIEPAALYGLAGDVVTGIEPFTEADPAGLLASYLVAFGNALGRTAHAVAEGAVHPGNLFVALVGATSIGRKGTAWQRVRDVVGKADPDWARTRVKSGLVSGEGIVHNVRDASDAPAKRKGDTPDPGEPDKRLFAYEPEFTRTLRGSRRESNTLSAVLRDAWDSPDVLSTLAKTSAERATAPHVSVLGHVVPEEVRRYLSSEDIAGGLANRLLWVQVRRSRVLPNGGDVPPEVLASLVQRTRGALEHGRGLGRLNRDEAASDEWDALYPDLTAAVPGPVGAMLARGAPQVLRLCVLFAILDLDTMIRPAHLHAAMALWRYCAASVRYVFGEQQGDPVADRVLDALRDNPEGMTRTALIRKVFKGHVAARTLSDALLSLESGGLATRTTTQTEGRPREVWTVTRAKQANDANNCPGRWDASTSAMRNKCEESPVDFTGTPFVRTSFATSCAPETQAPSLPSHDSLVSPCDKESLTETDTPAPGAGTSAGAAALTRYLKAKGLTDATNGNDRD